MHAPQARSIGRVDEQDEDRLNAHEELWQQRAMRGALEEKEPIVRARGRPQEHLEHTTRRQFARRSLHERIREHRRVGETATNGSAVPARGGAVLQERAQRGMLNAELGREHLGMDGLAAARRADEEQHAAKPLELAAQHGHLAAHCRARGGARLLQRDVRRHLERRRFLCKLQAQPALRLGRLGAQGVLERGASERLFGPQSRHVGLVAFGLLRQLRAQRGHLRLERGCPSRRGWAAPG